MSSFKCFSTKMLASWEVLLLLGADVDMAAYISPGNFSMFCRLLICDRA